MPRSARSPILQPGDTCWRLEPAQRMAVLVDGAAYFEAFAAAARAARHSLLIVGWDIDSRLRLRRGDAAGATPPLGAFLDGLAAARPELRVHILAWDFAMIYALEREALPVFKLGWQTHPNVAFRLDGEHPLGGSQHQKIVVVDDRLAFVGGLDLTRMRWDTPAHRPDDPRRQDPTGVPYAPFHDVQVMVDGAAAAALGRLARERWRFATGERLAPPPARDGPDPWPADVRPQVKRVRVGIVRTVPAYKTRPEAREVERLYAAGIAAARRHIYIENQYFTSNAVREALAERLREPDGPEVVIVLPCTSSGWLEETAMDTLRARQLGRLRTADAHGRLRVYFPTNEAGPGPGAIQVHAKLMVVDDRLFLAGSANLSNRSMGLDNECNLAVEAGPGDGRVRSAIAGLRDGLLAEHLGSAPTAVAERVRARGSLCGAVEALHGRGRTLHPLDVPAPRWVPELRDDEPLLDPERPVAIDRMMDDILEHAPSDGGRGGLWWRVGLPALLVLGVLAFWRWAPLGQALNAALLVEWAAMVEGSPLAWLWVLLAYVAGSFLLVPITLLIGATAAAFDPLPALGHALAGSLAAAVATYAAGHWLGRGAVRRVTGDRLNRLSRHLARQGLAAVVLVRMLPVAPFTVVNLVAGASHIRFRHFVAGTLLGMTPGILGLTVLVDRVRSALLVPTPANVAVLAAVAVALVGVGLWLTRRLTRQVRRRWAGGGRTSGAAARRRRARVRRTAGHSRRPS